MPGRRSIKLTIAIDNSIIDGANWSSTRQLTRLSIKWPTLIEILIEGHWQGELMAVIDSVPYQLTIVPSVARQNPNSKDECRFWNLWWGGFVRGKRLCFVGNSYVPWLSSFMANYQNLLDPFWKSFCNPRVQYLEGYVINFREWNGFSVYTILWTNVSFSFLSFECRGLESMQEIPMSVLESIVKLIKYTGNFNNQQNNIQSEYE